MKYICSRSWCIRHCNFAREQRIDSRRDDNRDISGFIQLKYTSEASCRSNLKFEKR